MDFRKYAYLYRTNMMFEYQYYKIKKEFAILMNKKYTGEKKILKMSKYEDR